MGVEFFPCENCTKTICDCGDYVRCECGYKWCSKKCAEEHGFKRDYDEDASSCKWCRSEDVEDNVLLEFLLKKVKWTRQQAVDAYHGKKKK